jgi:hypothetical protein
MMLRALMLATTVVALGGCTDAQTASPRTATAPAASPAGGPSPTYAGNPSPTQTGPTPTLADPTPTLTPGEPAAERWIGVRVVDGVGEFYDTRTGDRFVPRGMNYNRFLPASSLGGLADNLFTTRHYDPATVETDMDEMAALGFNTLRVMIETCDPGDGCIARGPASAELNLDYIDNVVDFLRRARDHGLVVMIASNTLPDDSFWLHQTAALQDDRFQSANNEFLNPRAVPLYVDYWTKVVRALVERGAPTEVIWAYQLRQEHHFQAAFPPFTLTSGTVSTANGQTYDMASPADKERMVDEGLVHWADVLRSAIRETDPGALVTVGFFVPNAPNPIMDPTDSRLVRTAYFLRNSTADFVDLHHYSGNGVDDAHIWENFGIAGVDDKPIVLGEYGAFRHWWSGPVAAATAAMGMEVGACRVGFDGYLLWAWRGDQSPDIWWANEGDRQVARAVAPVERPDPCQYGAFDFARYNVAVAATARASSAVEGLPASNVNDGTSAHWNAAEQAPGYVELRLASPSQIDEFVLVVAQDPPGPSVHQLWVQRTGGDLERVHVFRGVTREGDVLRHVPPEPLRDVEVVRVVTRQLGNLAPAWHEIELLSSVPPN